MAGFQSEHLCSGCHCPESGPLSLIYSLSSFVRFPTDDWHLAICFILYTFCWRCGWQLVTQCLDSLWSSFHTPPFPHSSPLRKTKCWGRDHVSNQFGLGWNGVGWTGSGAAFIYYSDRFRDSWTSFLLIRAQFIMIALNRIHNVCCLVAFYSLSSPSLNQFRPLALNTQGERIQRSA